MKKAEPNLFAPTAAWRKRDALRDLTSAATDAAEGAEDALNRKDWADYEFNVRQLARASAKLAKWYFARNTARAVERERKRRVFRRMHRIVEQWNE